MGLQARVAHVRRSGGVADVGAGIAGLGAKQIAAMTTEPSVR